MKLVKKNIWLAAQVELNDLTCVHKDFLHNINLGQKVMKMFIWLNLSLLEQRFSAFNLLKPVYFP